MKQRCSITGKRSLQQKFTLVEMLVVIAIISILSALLLPALNKAKQAAHSVSCLNNTKNIMSGLMFYADSYRYFPARMNATTGIRWYQRVYESISGDSAANLVFYKNSGYFNCPAYQYEAAGANIHQGTIAYGKSDVLGGWFATIRPEQIKRPSKVAAIGDSDDDGFWGAIISHSTYLLGNRHEERSSVSFVDGHAKSILAESVIAPDVVYGLMDYSSGATIVRSSATAIPFAAGYMPMEVIQMWNN